MDDSASALDFATDAALRHAIHEQTKGMTVFIVSQRATSIKQADKILVLDDGALAGVGTHKELMESCQVYREICLSQLSEQEVTDNGKEQRYNEKGVEVYQSLQRKDHPDASHGSFYSGFYPVYTYSDPVRELIPLSAPGISKQKHCSGSLVLWQWLCLERLSLSGS